MASRLHTSSSFVVVATAACAAWKLREFSLHASQPKHVQKKSPKNPEKNKRR
jgi:hypothetical protein